MLTKRNILNTIAIKEKGVEESLLVSVLIYSVCVKCVQNLDVVFSTILLVSNLNDSYSFSSRRLSDRILSIYLVLNTTWFVSVLPFCIMHHFVYE